MTIEERRALGSRASRRPVMSPTLDDRAGRLGRRHQSRRRVRQAPTRRGLGRDRPCRPLGRRFRGLWRTRVDRVVDHRLRDRARQAARLAHRCHRGDAIHHCRSGQALSGGRIDLAGRTGQRLRPADTDAEVLGEHRDQPSRLGVPRMWLFGGTRVTTSGRFMSCCSLSDQEVELE